ncbi:hypothetical protein GQ473_04165 [archaeon]|nr:hypothetical protein [archaeon]
MSQNWYIKNMDKNEYITSDGNGNFHSTLRGNNPTFIIWVMLELWCGDNIKAFPEHEIPGGYNGILKSINKTNEYRQKFEMDNKSVKIPFLW